jgi:cobalamin biosynthetic protein CobC
MVQPDILLNWANMLAKADSILVVDEAFMDLMPDQSLCAHDLPPNLIIFRSFGKFFGLAGLRLGFVRISPDCPGMKAFSNTLWPVSGLTLRAAAYAMRDVVWIREMQMGLSRAAKRMKATLKQQGLNHIGGTDLYHLVEAADAQQIYHQLLQQGIYVRRFDYNQSWLRFGLPGNENDWQHLEMILSGMKHDR